MPDSNSAWDELSTETAPVLFCDPQIQIVARSKTNAPGALRNSAGVLLQLAELFALPVTMSVVPEEERAPEPFPNCSAKALNNFFAPLPVHSLMK